MAAAAPPPDAWARYTQGRRAFSTAFWLRYLLGLAGAHRFYVGLRRSGFVQLAMGLGSLLAMLALARSWGAGIVVFFAPFAACGWWLWWDGYNLRDMVRDHNHLLAMRVGLDPEEAERWERQQDGRET
jgi:hypothetical protein